eukprot:15028357-Ditylum_brightwellii.AAC.1
MSQRSNSITTGAMIACDINSESPLSQDEHTQVLAANKSDLKQSSNKPLIVPTSKPLVSVIHDKLLIMMQKMEEDLKQDIQDFQDLQQR